MIPLGVLASARVAAAGSSWTPADLTGLFAWFDAADATTITSSGGLVSQWASKVPSGRDVTQDTDAAKPTTGTRTIGGLNVLDFDGGDLLISASTGAGVSHPFTVALVAIADTPSATNGPGRYINLRDNGGLFVNANSATSASIYGSSIGSFAVSNAGMDLTAAHQVTGIFDGEASSVRYGGGTYVNTGALAGTIYAGLRIILGDNSTAPGAGFNGALAEVVIVSGALAGADLTNLETYLTTKWSIA